MLANDDCIGVQAGNADHVRYPSLFGSTWLWFSLLIVCAWLGLLWLTSLIWGPAVDSYRLSPLSKVISRKG